MSDTVSLETALDVADNRSSGFKDELKRKEKIVAINAQTGTTYTFVIGDAGKRVRCTNANAITVTVPQNSSVAYDIGTVIEVEQGGAGVVTLDEDTNVVINGALKTWGQYSAVRLLKLDTNLWTVDGGSE